MNTSRSQPVSDACGTTSDAEPSGWRVKDYADGWIYFTTAAEALAEVQAMGGALLEPVWTRGGRP